MRVIPKELQRSIWLDTGCNEANLESGLQLFSLTKSAFLGAQVKYRVPLNVPSVQPAHSSSWKKQRVGEHKEPELWRLFPNIQSEALHRDFATQP